MQDGTHQDSTIDGDPYTPTGTVGQCTGDELDGCDTTTPVAVANLCLADGTPIVVVVQRDCDGTVSAPGYVTLTTGAYTAGPVPSDATPCDASVGGDYIPLCDVQDDGTVVGFLRQIETAADGTTTVTDTTVDGQPYTPTGEVGMCAASAPCASPTQAVSTTGLCLADGTPIAVTTERDCDAVVTVTGWADLLTGTWTAGPPPADATACMPETVPCASPTTPITTTGLCLADGTPIATVAQRDCDGVVTQTGWLDLTSGAYTSGLPPAGAISCSESRSIQVSGVFCDINPADGSVYALVLVEYQYDDTGAIESTRLVLAADGSDYTLQGELSICPGDGSSMDVETELLCMVDADGAVLQEVVGEFGYDSVTGNRLFVRFTDPTTGAVVAPPAGATVGSCAVVGGDVEMELLCYGTPADGFTTPFLRYYRTAEDGTVTTTDTNLAGAPLTIPPGNVINRCVNIDTETWPMCVVDASGEIVRHVRGVRRFRTDMTGAVPGVTFFDPATGNADTLAPGESYAVCPDTQCQNASTVLMLCGEGTEPGAPSITDTDPTPYFTFEGHQALPGGGQALWDGGSLIFPEEATPAPGSDQQYHNSIAARITMAAPGCDNGTGTAVVTAVVTVENLGPNPGYILDGQFRLLNADGTELDVMNIASGAPVGHVQELTVTATVPLSQLDAGDVVVWLDTENLDTARGPKAWEARGFSYTIEPTLPAVCVPPFFRTVVTDCEGATVAVVDTDLNGDPYTVPEGAVVGPCGMGGPTPEPCTQSTTVVPLCDLNPAADPSEDGSRCPTPFLRKIVTSCDGAVVSITDTEMDGATPHTPFRVVSCDNAPSLREQVWNTVSIAPDPADTTGATYLYTIANSEDPSQTGVVRMVASEPPGDGCPTTPDNPGWNAGVNFRFEPDATVLNLAHVLRIDALDWDTFEDKIIPSGFPVPFKVESDLGHTQTGPRSWHSVADDNTGHFYFRVEPGVRIDNANTGGGLACTSPTFGFITLVDGPPCGSNAGVDAEPLMLCDDNGAFLRHIRYDLAGTPTSVVDTTLGGTAAYTPVGTVRSCTATTPADASVATGIRRLAAGQSAGIGSPIPAGVQSITVTVVAGTAMVTTSDGIAPVTAGVSLTWSTNDDDDASLAAWSATAQGTGSDVLVHWTSKPTAAG